MKIGLLTIVGVLFYLNWFMSTANAAAEFKNVDIANFTVDYRNGMGTAAFEHLKVQLGDMHVSLKDYHVDINKNNGKVLFAKEDTSLLIEKIQGSVIDSVETLALHNASIYINPETAFKFHMDGGEFSMGDGTHTLGELSVECKAEPSRNGDMYSYIRPCFKLGRIAIPYLNIDELSRDTLGKFFPVNEIEGPEYLPEMKKLKGPDVLKNINMMIYNNKYNLTLNTKFIFNLKLKIEGSALYQEEQNRIVFSVDKAKVGWLSVKKLVLKEIKEAGIKNVEVFGYNIIINL